MDKSNNNLKQPSETPGRFRVEDQFSKLSSKSLYNQDYVPSSLDFINHPYPAGQEQHN